MQLNEDYVSPTIRKEVIPVQNSENHKDSLWQMWFDGAASKDGSGAGIVFMSPAQEIFPISYKLEFENTNNTAEYEALILGLWAAIDMKIQRLKVFGDSELVIH